MDPTPAAPSGPEMDEEVGADGHGVDPVTVAGATMLGVDGATVSVVLAGAAGLIVIKLDGGLRPPAPSSVEPIGIPSLPTATEAMPVGDDDDAAGWPRETVLAAVEQAPETVPANPPPSKVDIGVDVPALGSPRPVDALAVELPMPAMAPVMEPPVVPVIELPTEVPVVVLPMPPIAVLAVDRPKDACGIEPPMPEHAVTLPVGAIGDAPDASGLVPGVAIAVAPRPIPAGATGAPGPMPSGDVMPRAGVGLPPMTCARPGSLPKSVAAIATINARFIPGSI